MCIYNSKKMPQNCNNTNFPLTHEQTKENTQEKNPTPNKYIFPIISKKIFTKDSSKQATQTPKVIPVNRPTPKHFHQQINNFF